MRFAISGAARNASALHFFWERVGAWVSFKKVQHPGFAGIQYMERTLAEKAGLSLPTIQRMEASDGQVRGVVDSLVKVVQALEAAGIELIGENAQSSGGGRGGGIRPAG